MRVRRFDVTDYQKDVLQKYLLPPEDITVSEWAEKYRMLDSKTSAQPGPWKNSTTAYLAGIMDEFNNYETEEIVFVKPTQVGGTESMQNMIGYVIMQDPAPTMVVYPTDTLAKSISENRLQPMIMSSPELAKRYYLNASSVDELQFDGMYLSLAGSNSPSALASKPIRYLFLDEVDKYPGASKKESDPISLARERTKTFHNRKVYITSTPTLKSGHIWKAKEQADIEKHFFIPCPHCSEMIELKFKQIRFPNDENMSIADKAEFAAYVCQECGCVITDQQKNAAVGKGEWKIVKRNTKFVKKVAYWMNTLYSPFTKFSEIVKKFLESKDDPEMLQNFVNSWLAEPWEDTKLKTTADLVLERQTDIGELIVPDWAKMLTAGIDVQETCLYWTIRAWGNFLTSQNIAHGQALSFKEIENVMNYTYAKQNGDQYMISLALMDSGDQTDAVYDFCASNSEWCLPVKGSSMEMQTHFRLSTINKAGSKAYGMTLVLTDGDKYKDMIAGRMMRENGTGSWMVYKGCDKVYAEQVTAEHKINIKVGGRSRQKWVPKASHADNHYLDAEVYAAAAADIMDVRFLHLKDEEPDPVQRDKEEKQPEESWIAKNEQWLS